MTGLLVVRHDQDWTGFAIVIGILLVLSVLAYLDVWRADRRVERFDPEPETDHIECANDDCEQIICCCPQRSECPGASTLGCSHGEELCWDCRFDCRECRIEHALAWANGR